MKAVQARTRITLKKILFATDFSPAGRSGRAVRRPDRSQLRSEGVRRAHKAVRELRGLSTRGLGSNGGNFRPEDQTMAIHEKLTRIPKHELQQVGWSKATELVKVARNGETFDCATWLHKAKELPKEGFKCAVERHLTGKETEPWEILYFKVYKSQLSVVEKALETAALMLGSDKSRGYCLEMICADFLAGANLPEGE